MYIGSDRCQKWSKSTFLKLDINQNDASDVSFEEKKLRRFNDRTHSFAEKKLLKTERYRSDPKYITYHMFKAFSKVTKCFKMILILLGLNSSISFFL